MNRTVPESPGEPISQFQSQILEVTFGSPVLDFCSEKFSHDHCDRLRLPDDIDVFDIKPGGFAQGKPVWLENFKGGLSIRVIDPMRNIRAVPFVATLHP